MTLRSRRQPLPPVALLGIMTLASACGSPSEPRTREPGPPAQVQFVGQPTDMMLGERFDLQVSILDANGVPVSEIDDEMIIFSEEGAEGYRLGLGGTLRRPIGSGSLRFPDLSPGTVGRRFAISAVLRAADITGTSDPFDVSVVLRGASVGSGQVCGLTDSGQAVCWGIGPVSLTGGGETFTVISRGGAHTCAVTADHVAFCWGQGGFGQLGDGTGLTQTAPTPVSGGLAFQSVRASGAHSCGLTLDGKAYCWGAEGLVGDGTGARNDGVFENRLEPVQVLGDLTFVELDVAGTGAGVAGHSCGVTDASDAYCWGPNHFGQLGDASTTDALEPVLVSGGHQWATVSTGNGHTCGLTTGGDAYCWGTNNLGQLGNGAVSTGIHSEPEPVVGSMTFSAISAGYGHTCALTADGQAYCWGYNSNGELGDGTTQPRYEPGRVSIPRALETVSAGRTGTCGFAVDGLVYCWGLDVTSRLSSSPVLVPTIVPGQGP